MASDFGDDVEFLDLGADGGSDGVSDGGIAEDGADWLEEPGDEERVAAGRDPRLLPPRATPRRALASALSLALVVSAAIGAGSAAYHRHETDVRIADTLRLAASSTAPAIPGLTELAFAARWHAHLDERIVIPVVNKSPNAVTLVDGRLTEAGLRGTSTLKPLGEATVPPGGTGKLAGTVTADCTTQFEDAVTIDPNKSKTTATVTINGDGTITGTGTLEAQRQARMGRLQVRARSVSGHVGEQTIFPESGLSDTADRICSQQGGTVAHTSGVKVAVDPHTHSFRVSLTAKSVADTALNYVGNTGWAAQPTALGLKLNDSFTPVTESGTVQPGGTFTVSFQMTVEHCPTTPTFADDNLLLSLLFVLDTSLVSAENDTVAYRAVINEACGHPADWKG